MKFDEVKRLTDEINDAIKTIKADTECTKVSTYTKMGLRFDKFYAVLKEAKEIIDDEYWVDLGIKSMVDKMGEYVIHLSPTTHPSLYIRCGDSNLVSGVATYIKGKQYPDKYGDYAIRHTEDLLDRWDAITEEIFRNKLMEMCLENLRKRLEYANKENEKAKEKYENVCDFS